MPLSHYTTVAVLGRLQEDPCALLLQALADLPCRVLRLNQGRAQRAATAWGLDAHGALVGQVDDAAGAVALGDISGLYLRPADERQTGACDRAAAQGWTQAWIEIAELAPWPVANRVSAMLSNGSKVFQSQCLAAAGFAVPPMLLSNAPDAVLAFEAAHGPLIYKSASGVRSIVCTLDGASRARLHDVRHTPTLFQKRLSGTNVRVHVVGHTVFATEIDSDVVDYRYAGQQGGQTELRATTLPQDLQALCIKATRELGLDFAGLDLMLADDGLAYCFEANPSPGYSWYESATGQPIAAALARHLCGID